MLLLFTILSDTTFTLYRSSALHFQNLTIARTKLLPKLIIRTLNSKQMKPKGQVSATDFCKKAVWFRSSSLLMSLNITRKTYNRLLRLVTIIKIKSLASIEKVASEIFMRRETWRKKTFTKVNMTIRLLVKKMWALQSHITNLSDKSTA